MANLVDDAVRYNEPDGRVTVSTGSTDGGATVRVTNTGPVVAPDEVARLVQPFRRGATPRVRAGGHGLGLSIVAAVVAAHQGDLRVEPRPEGGLDVLVTIRSA